MKNTWKKVLFSLWAVALLWAGSTGLVNAATTTATTPATPGVTDQGGVPQQNDQYCVGSSCLSNKWDRTLLQSAITLVNRVMSMLSVVALVVLLIGGYRMITANWDETKYKKGLSVLKQAAIWLIIIWLSWAIIRIIFRFINKTDQNSGYNAA